MKHHTSIPGIVLAAVAVLAPLALAADAPVKKEGVNLVAVGNSQTHPLRWLEPLSQLSGHPGYKHVDISILGTPLRGNYQHPELNQWTERLNENTAFDAMVLYIREEKSYENDVYAAKWAEEAYKANPRCQVFLQQGGPVADQDWNNPPWEKTEANAEWVADAFEKAHPDAPMPRIIPESLLRRELGRLADRGELPGVANHFELMGDSGHLNEVGQYGLLVLTASMLYQEPPFGYPTDIYRTDPKGQPIRGMYQSITIPPETADVIKRAAWDILQTYPPSGIKAGLIIANRRLDPLVAGQPAKIALTALHASGTATWSLTKGSLPLGLTLSPQGVFSGIPTAPGELSVTIKVADNTGATERALVISVAKDLPPAIPEHVLPAIPLDRRAFQQLKAEGGVGQISWAIAGGKLPYGVMLTSSGLLIGNPGESGTFSFQVKASDSHPAGARTAEKTLTWKIEPASAECLQVPMVMKSDTALLAKAKLTDSTFVIDGKLDEGFWKLDQSINKAVLGEPTKKAVFGAVWTTDPWKVRLSLPETGSKSGTELLFAVKVTDGQKGKTPQDGVHLYLDARNDRSHTYAADDLHFFIPRTPPNSRSGVVWITGKVDWFIKAAVSETADGYIVEASMTYAYFTGEGNWLSFGSKGVYGFDLVVSEGIPGAESRSAWRGDVKNDTDTGRFGSIVLLDESVPGFDQAYPLPAATPAAQ